MPLPGKDYSSATYGFELICFLLENPIHTVTIPIPLVLAGLYLTGNNIVWLPLYYILALVIPATLFVGVLIVQSYCHDGGAADWSEFIEVHDKDLEKSYKGQKMPIFTMVEAYMAGKIDLKKDMLEILMHRNELFRFNFTLDLCKWFFKDFIAQMTGHTEERDHHEVGDVYNRGNDFYAFFLGEMMIYTSGIYTSLDDSLEEAQRRKLDTIAKYIHLKEGEEHLDIGCGWGTLISYFAKNYGSNSTGCTLAKEQVEWGKKTAAKYGVAEKVNFLCCDYRLIPEKTNDKKYNKITCLEMAEHVGIKNFATFLRQVYDMLEDDGMFYLQIAGLRRTWQYEDLVWGCFMGKYIFPGADASCPLGFVTGQLERAGFEVHRVENCGVHYSRTIQQWYDNWVDNKDKVLNSYGQFWYRMWVVFLAWSTMIARQGSSTVFMVTCNKNIKNDASSVADPVKEKAPFNRLETFIGSKPVATQQ